MSCIHPKIGFLDLLDRNELPADFVWDIERWKTRSGAVKINVAISELPDFTVDAGQGAAGAPHRARSSCASRRSTPSARSRTRTSIGRPANAPFVDGTIPTTLDKKLAPEGVHVFSMFTQWVPEDWKNEPHREELDAYAKRIFDGYDELAPNFKSSIIDYQVIGPYDMEQDLGLIGGNIFHGELSVDQLFHMRPAPGFADFRTPIKGLYHGSCATHGGRRRERHPRLAGVQGGRRRTRRSRRSTVDPGDARSRTREAEPRAACSRRGPSRSSAPRSRKARSAVDDGGARSAAATRARSSR